MQKKVYFLSGFPRAGNTIISTILNQNKNIATSGHSSLPDCFFKIESIKYTDIYNNFKNNKAIENIQKNLVLNFYKDWKQPYIIDRGEWGTPFNYEIMKKYCPNEFKIIFLLRNPLDIIRSYLKICIDNPNFYINKQFNFLDKTTLHKTELEEKIELITKKGDFFDVSLFTYKNLKNKKNVLFIKYEDFCKDTLSNQKYGTSACFSRRLKKSFKIFKKYIVHKRDGSTFEGFKKSECENMIKQIELKYMFSNDIEKYEMQMIQHLDVEENEESDSDSDDDIDL